MRNRFDQFGKQMVRAALQSRGSIETDAEVAVNTRRIDLWFTPGPGCAPAPDHLGVLGDMTSSASTFEFFHSAPSGDDLAACVIKHGDFRHFLSQRWTLPLAPTPTQWVISAGRPDAGIEGLWLRRVSNWPSGVYEGPPLLWTRLVVVNELPVARNTLLLRLLGAGSVLQRAITELKAWTSRRRSAPSRFPSCYDCGWTFRPILPSRPETTRSFSWIRKTSWRHGDGKRSGRASHLR